MQIVKVMDKPEFPKYYVNAKTGKRVRIFSKSDVPRSGYLPEADYEAAMTEAKMEASKAEALAVIKARVKAEKAA